MSRPAKPCVLKCGEHLLGEVSLDYWEMWHNEGTLVPGPDLPRYQTLFEEYRRLDRQYGAAETDEAIDRASEERDVAAEQIDQLGLCLVEAETARVMPIHDFHPLDERGKVYWRFKNDGAKLPREGVRDWTVFALIVAAIPFTFIYMFGCWLAKKCRRTHRSSGPGPRV